MPSAELLDNTRLSTPDSEGHNLWVGHVRTGHGIATVRSEIPESPEDDYYFVGGWLAGGAYEQAACSVAHAGHIGRTIRHGSNGYRGAIEADAAEVTGVIEALSQDRKVHIVAHSKAGRVAIKAAAKLSSDIEVGSIIFINPAIGKSRLPHNVGEILGIAIEHAAAYVSYPRRMAHAAKGVLHEIRRRPSGVMGELAELLSDDDQSGEMQLIHERGARTVLVTGSFDHMVPDQSMRLAADRYHFDEEVRTSGIVNGGHFGIMAVSGFMEEVMGKKAS